MNILIVLTEVFEKLILAGLFFLSVWSVSIMIDRYRSFKKELMADFEEVKNHIQQKDWAKARQWSQSHQGLVANALNAALRTSSAESVDRAVSSSIKQDRIRLEKGLAILATMGANAPFVGLFGTVLGIIRAFAYLGSQSGSAAVMTGVSQALYATALGLFVAIPAVVAFNIFSRRIRTLVVQVESLRDLYISLLKVDNGRD